MMAGAELSSKGDNRFDTGKAFFAVIATKEMETFSGSHPVWTDGHKSYGFLSSDPNYSQGRVRQA